jgi:hypothetical protein
LDDSQEFGLLRDILVARFEQHPALITALDKNRLAWLETCSFLEYNNAIGREAYPKVYPLGNPLGLIIGKVLEQTQATSEL